MELGFKCGHRQFVLSNIWSIELKAANTILDICVPSETVSFEIEYLDISIIISCSYTPLFSIVCITECDSPAVWLDCFALCWLERYYWGILPWVPDPYASVGTACH